MRTGASAELFVREYGLENAPAVVLLHGGGISGWMWDCCVAFLGGYRSLVPDLPEHGGSRDIKPLSVEGGEARVADLIRARIPGGRAHVVGHSLGGQVLVELLVKGAEVVDRAVLSSALVRPLPLVSVISRVSQAVLPLMHNRPCQRLQARAYHIPHADFETY